MALLHHERIGILSETCIANYSIKFPISLSVLQIFFITFMTWTLSLFKALKTPSSLYMPDFHWVISKWCCSFFHHLYEVDKTLENPGLLYLQVSFTIFTGRSLFHILWWISPHTATRAMTREWSTWGSTTKSNTSSPSTTPEDICFCFTSAMTPPSLFTILNVDLPAKPCIL